MTPAEWNECVALINTFWRQSKMDDGEAGIWFTQVNDVDVEVMRVSIGALAREQKWPPSLAEILEEVGTSIQSNYLPYTAAFQGAKNATYRWDKTGTPIFHESQPEIGLAVRIMGWEQMFTYNTDTEENRFIEKTWKPAYLEACRQLDAQKRRERNDQITGGDKQIGS